MFGSGVSRDEHDALAGIVMQQSQVLNLMQEQAESYSDLFDQLGDFTGQARSELLVIKAVLGAIIAEIAAKRDNPYKELQDIIGRIRYAADGVSLDESGVAGHSSAARDFICEYARDYLRLGDPA